MNDFFDTQDRSNKAVLARTADSMSALAGGTAEDDEMPWERVSPPVWWPGAGRHVVADRHLSVGTRQHMVEGSVPAGTVIANAQIVGADDVPDAQFSATPSHLSK